MQWCNLKLGFQSRIHRQRIVFRLLFILTAFLLPSCEGVQSTLAPAGKGAEQIATLFWWMTGGAVIIWTVVIGIAIYTLSLNPVEHRRKQLATSSIRIRLTTSATMSLAGRLRTFKMNIYGYFRMCKAALKHMQPGSCTLIRVRSPDSKGVPDCWISRLQKVRFMPLQNRWHKTLWSEISESIAWYSVLSWTPLNPAERTEINSPCRII